MASQSEEKKSDPTVTKRVKLTPKTTQQAEWYLIVNFTLDSLGPDDFPDPILIRTCDFPFSLPAINAKKKIRYEASEWLEKWVDQHPESVVPRNLSKQQPPICIQGSVQYFHLIGEI